MEFFDDMLQLGNYSDEVTIESLWRHIDGRLFLTHTDRGPLTSDETFREASFDEACAWLLKLRLECVPEKWLALHGSTCPQALNKPESTVPAPAAVELSTVVPSLAAIRLVDALAWLKHRANEAGALALLNADKIKREMGEAGGWESLDLEGFTDGAQGLAHAAMVRIRSVVSALAKMHQPGIDRLRKLPAPVARAGMNRDDEIAIQDANCVGWSDSSTLLEHSVGELGQLLDLQSSAMDARQCESWHLAKAATGGLNSAFDDFFKAQLGFFAASVAVECAHRATEQRAAA